MSARIEGIVARLHGLHPRLIDLSLDRLRELLAKLDHPERRLPPVIHVAGTNGKGSTCAFVRAMCEAAGQSVHVYTSPHLVRFNERIRVAGELVSDEALVAALEHIEQVNAGAPITVFEVITAVAFHVFAQTPADLCVLEVGLGGRGDATNVIDRPAACAITSISLDHRELLGETLDVIAAEKAGIMKRDVPVAIGSAIGRGAGRVAGSGGARRHAGKTARSRLAFGRGSIQRCRWHARSAAAVAGRSVPIGQRRHRHRGTARVGAADGCRRHRAPQSGRRACSVCAGGCATLLAGGLGSCGSMSGHNPRRRRVGRASLVSWSDRPVHLVVGLKQTKDAGEFLRPLIPLSTTLWAVAEPGQHDDVARGGNRSRFWRRGATGPVCDGRAAHLSRDEVGHGG